MGYTLSRGRKRRDAYQKRFGSDYYSFTGVIAMLKSDVLTGLFVGVILGLIFTPQLTPHLAVIVILAVVFGGRMINLK